MCNQEDFSPSQHWCTQILLFPNFCFTCQSFAGGNNSAPKFTSNLSLLYSYQWTLCALILQLIHANENDAKLRTKMEAMYYYFSSKSLGGQTLYFSYKPAPPPVSHSWSPGSILSIRDMHSIVSH